MFPENRIRKRTGLTRPNRLLRPLVLPYYGGGSYRRERGVGGSQIAYSASNATGHTLNQMSAAAGAVIISKKQKREGGGRNDIYKGGGGKQEGVALVDAIFLWSQH